MLLVIIVALVTLAALNAILTAWATMLDTRHASSGADHARSGRNSRQVSSGLAGGAGLSAPPRRHPRRPARRRVKGRGRKLALPSPALWLVVTLLGTLLTVAALTTVMACIGAPRPAAETLQAETA